jgi:AcrR family transcriptional regulator
MPKVTKRIPPERSDELVQVSAETFRERGYDGTSMQEIADRMGILKGSLYYYVKTKGDLLWMVVEPPLRELVEAADGILSDTSVPLRDRLETVIVAHAESFEANFPHMFVMTRENGDTLSKKRRKDLDALRRRYFELLREAIISGQKSGELRKDIDSAIAVHGIFGMLNWMFRWFDPKGRMKADDIAKEFAQMAIDGLIKRKRG